MPIDKDFIAEVQETIKNGVEIGTVFFTPLEHRQIETAFKQLTDAVKKFENEIESLEAMTGDQFVEWKLNRITKRGDK